MRIVGVGVSMALPRKPESNGVAEKANDELANVADENENKRLAKSVTIPGGMKNGWPKNWTAKIKQTPNLTGRGKFSA